MRTQSRYQTACPACHARAGRPCQNGEGQRLQGVHVQRLSALRAQTTAALRLLYAPLASRAGTTVAVLATAFLLAAPLFAQITDVRPAYGGGYTAYTSNGDGSASTTDFFPTYGGGYTAYTSTSQPYPDSAIDAASAEEDRRQEAEDRERREDERRRRADDTALDQMVSNQIREQDAERRELAAAERSIASAPSYPASNESAFREQNLWAPRPVDPFAGPPLRPRHGQLRANLAHPAAPGAGACSKAAVDAWFRADERMKARETAQCNASPLACEIHQMPPLTCGHRRPRRP